MAGVAAGREIKPDAADPLVFGGLWVACSDVVVRFDEGSGYRHPEAYVLLGSGERTDILMNIHI
jgi:hypothetical protein